MMLRRRLLRYAGAMAVAGALPSSSFAFDYPTRAARVIVPFTPGGGADITGRLTAQWLSDHLGQAFVIENKPGAGSNLGTETVVTAAPDGYTLLLINAGNAINATLYQHLSFDFIRDIEPICSIIEAPHVMFVTPSFPAKTVAEFIAYAKANPGKVNFASAGAGNANHISAEMFKMMTGVDMVHVPFNGGAPALFALASGHVQVMFADTLTAGEQARPAPSARSVLLRPALSCHARRVANLGYGARIPCQLLVGDRGAAWHVRRYRQSTQYRNQCRSRQRQDQGKICRDGRTNTWRYAGWLP